MRRSDKFKYIVPYQKEWDAEEKAFRTVCEGCQDAQRKEKSRVTNLSEKVSKLDFEGRAANADPNLITFCEKYPHFVDDLATELYLQARMLFGRGSKMDTHLMVNMAHVITKLSVDSPTRKRCQTIYNQM
jgi:hypothetical protein